MRRFDGQTALITGASSGIGEALALELARRGAAVVLAARRVERLEELRAQIEAAGGRAVAVACDVTADGDCERAVQTAIDRFGALDVVVANAGFGVAGTLKRLELEDYRRQFETNVFGVLRTALAAREALVESRGRLAIIGSVAGYLTLAGSSPYGMSKAAVHALAESLYFELKPKGVAVIQVSPGFVESEIRQVDNRGVLHPERGDSISERIRMPADTAARKIADAIHRRRKVAVITGHGKVLVFLARHFPRTVAFLISRVRVSGRKEPGKKTR